MLKTINLNKSYQNLKVLENLNMAFEPGIIHCLFGASGCGKTTLLNILAGLELFDSGYLEGLSNKKLSFIFQEERLLPWATAKENILFILESQKETSDALLLAEKYLNLVELSEFANYHPENLSGGMQRRLSIAKALAYNGDILFMDEPFKGIHLELKSKLMDHIKELKNDKGKYILFTTHDISEAKYLSDKIHFVNGPPLSF